MQNKQHPHGGRQARLLDESGEAWYHVYNRIACHKDEYPLDEASEAKSTLGNFIHFYTAAYECQVATYTIMGNHYHLVLQMARYQKLSEEELQEKAALFYPNTHVQTQYWLPEHWEAFNRRLFSLPDLMRNIQQGFTRWFNKSQKRRGRLWADRFKSTLLYGEETLLECMQYVDLNPVRAGVVARPEDDQYSAYAQRQKQALPEHFLSLNELLHEDDEDDAFASYRTQVYLRGNIASKERQAEISDEEMEHVLNAPFDLGCAKRGEKRDHLRFFVDGLVLGSKHRVEGWLNELRDSGHYKRRKHPRSIGNDDSDAWFCLREQRSHFQGG